MSPQNPLASPLRQSNGAVITRKNRLVLTLYATLLENPSLFNESASPVNIKRWFDELFCLEADAIALAEELERLQEPSYVESFKMNINQLFVHAVKILATEERYKTRDNVVITLITLFKCLSRHSPSFFDVLVENEDSIFTILLVGIDEILDDSLDASGSRQLQKLRQKTISLSLLIVACTYRTAIPSFFCRKDLFSRLVPLIRVEPSPSTVSEAILLLSLLSNYKRFESKNPYRIRMNDLVEEEAMEIMLSSLEREITKATGAFTEKSQPSSFASSLTSLFFSIAELLKIGVYLPPPITPESTRKGKEREVEPLEEGESTQETFVPPAALAPKSPTPLVPTPLMLLPLYDLFTSNKTFATLSAANEPLQVAIISLASNLFLHASAGPNATIYARLLLMILHLLISGGIILHQEGEITPGIPNIPHPRPKVCTILDSCLIFFRFNMKRDRFDIQGYVLALELLRKILQKIRNSDILPEYDFVPLWRALISLSKFIENNFNTLREGTTKMEDLINQIFLTFSFSMYWSQSIFSTADGAKLFYELLHSHTILERLSDLLGVTQANSTPPQQVHNYNLVPPTPRYQLFSSSPIKPNFSNAISTSFTAIESISNVSKATTYFKAQIDLVKTQKRFALDDVLDADETILIIEESMQDLELLETEELNLMEEMEEDFYFFSELILIIAVDTIEIY